MADPSVETITSGRCLVARVSGEMDYVSAPVFRPKFEELIAWDDRFIVLDLSGVSFCDSAGLNVLIGAWRQADAGGALLVLACVPASLRRVLQMTGADQLLRVYDAVIDAEAVFGG
ncbi:anti-sigma B factor antagonist [Streptomyces sp. SAI-135]|uniref:STAS domain-containing protein n=1 Tax=unclassified Streptomyces TaxID=2593676 RepID=UPI0024753E53|nr:MULTISPECIES: STAS domain-containing protein [unclassified Streptomyces]MDH6523108.1 anti-sigma B factor antagonist [Streptomyces sp. SAI-090]MDH6554719.1 anti-sigma B factor antagonist [Streptomyces sp. SAI-041]MDH6573992.1 anti-sigma B factor antagonist [Streptomyces sp. SAI-117]MDH6581272.1 anti-sigma B factor antagonist [Streptomyces sp. SAI-133]MDH6613278.1 anti-sigma B factor antagonist [Streptomyces sp. SAI-135]